MRLKANMVCEHWINENATPTGEVITFDITRMVKDMSPDELDKLIGQVSKAHGQDLDYIGEQAGVVDQHNGPFTVKIDADELQAFVESGFDSKARYITGRWGHLFGPGNQRETLTEFVYDTEDETVLAVLIQHDAARDQWELASEHKRADLEDSLKNANPAALENPHEWDLDYADELPEWVPQQPALKM
jgi:hypothetical protein